MRISVGSKNPVKREAVERVVSKLWQDYEIIEIEVDSGVSDQPMSDEEGIQGALNRAKLSLRKANSDIGVGVEGSVQESKYGMFLSGWAAVMDKEGKTGIGGGGGLLLPEKIASELRKGKELGVVMDEFMGEKNIKQKQGAVGVLTNNLVSRADALERAVAFAFARFVGLGVCG